MIGPSFHMGGLMGKSRNLRRGSRTDDGTTLAQSKSSARKKSEDEEKAEAIKGAAGRFGRAATAKAKEGESAVGRLQRFGREELAKQEEKKRQKAKGVEPSKGFVERMMERLRSKKKNGE